MSIIFGKLTPTQTTRGSGFQGHIRAYEIDYKFRLIPNDNIANKSNCPAFIVASMDNENACIGIAQYVSGTKARKYLHVSVSVPGQKKALSLNAFEKKDGTWHIVCR